jgi:outer membrane protein assembly factor BamA
VIKAGKISLRLILFVHGLVLGAENWYQDSDSIIVQDIKNYSLVGIPLVYRLPETSWGFGGGGIYTVVPQKYDYGTRPTSTQLAFSYTLLDQILFLAPFLYFSNNNKWQVYGELGYFRFIYDYYGIGNSQPNDFKELFTVEYPRIRVNALYNILPNQYLGLRYWMDDWTMIQNEGELASGQIRGSQGGLISGLGIIHTFDTRDKVFDARKGWLVETILLSNGSFLGSDFTYRKFIVDARKYLDLGSSHGLAINLYSEFTEGDPPFNGLAQMGGPRRMRGYYEGRFRDMNLITYQMEYRFPIYWRFNGVLFGGIAAVDETYRFRGDIWRWSAGGGLRFTFDKQQRINIRMDYGITKESTGFYFTIGEAF